MHGLQVHDQPVLHRCRRGERRGGDGQRLLRHDAVLEHPRTARRSAARTSTEARIRRSYATTASTRTASPTRSCNGDREGHRCKRLAHADDDGALLHLHAGERRHLPALGLGGHRDPARPTPSARTTAAWGRHFIYAVEPDDAAVSLGGCDTGQSPAGNAADSTISTISHEHIEAVTDPYADGWWSEDPEPSPNNPSGPSGPEGPFYGSEIADLCAWNFGDPLGTTLEGESYNQVINGHNYFLQTEYSNADAGCVQYAGGDVTFFDTSSPLYPGVGPLVYHGGAVMTSTTIRAIYWIPAGPANSRLPTIAGSAKVGKKLRALHGAWSNSPTFAYRWLRCSAAGTSCKGIKKATDSAYTVAPGDTGHGLEVRVTATNPGGSANATSVPTGKVQVMTPMKTLLAGLLVLCALFVGSSSGVKASANLGMPSFIPHFGGNTTPSAAKAANTTADFTCGAITCEAYEAGVNGYLQDVAADSGGSNNVYSVATEYSDAGRAPAPSPTTIPSAGRSWTRSALPRERVPDKCGERLPDRVSAHDGDQQPT